MAASRNPRVRLRHLLDEAEQISIATQGMTYDRFRDSWLTRRAVEHGLLIVAEASKALPEELKQRYSMVPWARVEALGNILRHEYSEVDPRVLWRIVLDQLPVLTDTVRLMLEESEL